MAHEHVAEAGLLGVEEFESHLDVEEIDHEHAEVALEPEQLVAGVEHDLDDGGVGEEVVELPAAVVRGDRVDGVVDDAGTDLSMRNEGKEDHDHAAVAEIGAIAVLNHAHADAVEGLQRGDQVHDLLFRVDKHHVRVVQAARRRQAQIAAHFPVGELQVCALQKRKKRKNCGSRRSTDSGRWR